MNQINNFELFQIMFRNDGDGSSWGVQGHFMDWTHVLEHVLGNNKRIRINTIRRLITALEHQYERLG